MTDDETNKQTSPSEQALGAAIDVVDAAVEQVDRIGQHLREKIEAAKPPDAYVEILKNITKAAPIGMLMAAFIGGMLFARRR